METLTDAERQRIEEAVAKAQADATAPAPSGTTGEAKEQPPKPYVIIEFEGIDSAVFSFRRHPAVTGWMLSEVVTHLDEMARMEIRQYIANEMARMRYEEQQAKDAERVAAGKRPKGLGLNFKRGRKKH